MFQNTLIPPLKSPSQPTFLFKPNATMDNHDSYNDATMKVKILDMNEFKRL